MVGELDVFSALDYAGPVVGVMRSLKSDGRTGLARPLGAALRATLERAEVLPGGMWTGGATLSLVPVAIPSSPAAFARRGYRVVELIARRAGLRCLPVLRSVGAAIDQRALGRAERERNTEGMFAVLSVPRQPVVLIDDVITTGATLRAAADALRAEGATVLGAVTVASTPLRWTPNPR
jgi:predicted amidophosphoribosyltransferase